MSVAIQNISSKFEKIYDFEATEEVINAVIDTLVAENPSINVDSVNMAVQHEKIRRARLAEHKINVQEAMSPIYEYIERLVVAGIADMIHEHECFEIPHGSFDEEDDEDENIAEGIYSGGFFSVKIQNRYELACLDSWKDDTSNQGQFSLNLVGSLREKFKFHGLDIESIEVEFNGAPGDDSVVITSLDELYDCMGEISMSWKDSVTCEGLNALGKSLKENPNKNLLIQKLRDSER